MASFLQVPERERETGGGRSSHFFFFTFFFITSRPAPLSLLKMKRAGGWSGTVRGTSGTFSLFGSVPGLAPAGQEEAGGDEAAAGGARSLALDARAVREHD